MVEGTTKTGFEFRLNAEAFEDAEFLEEFVAVRDGDGLRFFALLEKLLGKEQKKKLYDHVRNEDGKVPAAALAKEFEDFAAALAENSQTKN